jgi:hypothetical protein
MLRRWIIRSLCLALLTLCVTAWVGSRFLRLDTGYISGRHVVWMRADSGTGYVGVAEYPPSNFKWYWNCTDARPAGCELMYQVANYHFFGFALTVRPVPSSGSIAFVPLWFPTTLSAGFLWLVCRKTRPKYNRKGFPVEVAGNATKP